MKKLSKVLVLVLSTIMVMAMSASVFASTITIDPGTPTGGSGTPTYSYYVMMKASVSGEKVAYYVENETLANALNGLTVGGADLFTVTKASGSDRWNVVVNKKSDDTAFTGEEIAAALDTIKSNAIQKTENTSDLTFTLKEGTEEYDGYVLVESSLGTKLVADTITSQTIKEKNTYPDVVKTSTVPNQEIGKQVPYTVTINVPANVAEKPIVVYDTITKGLTLNTAITATPTISGLTWAQDGDAAADGSKTYKATIPASVVKAQAGSTIVLTYTATVNENAVVNVPEVNKAKIVYDNYTSVETEPVEVVTFGFDLLKIGDGNEQNPLAGVKFTLTNGSNEYYDQTAKSNPRFVTAKKEVVTADDGTIVFEGLAQGTYTLTETETQDGYNLLPGPITVIMAADGTATFNGTGAEALQGNSVVINNESGTVLPGTGGIGTTIFYVLGSLLVIGCGIVLISKKRMQNNK